VYSINKMCLTFQLRDEVYNYLHAQNQTQWHTTGLKYLSKQKKQ